MSKKKIKILTLGDMPLSTSGVAHQSRLMIEGLVSSGKFQVISLGGAIKHGDYKPIRTEEFGEDWTIFPVEGFGNHDILRSVIRNERPDICWIMTDPRFYDWFWQIEDEIRPLMPIVYYHVWDNYPYPKFNRKWYLSNDVICTISKLTDDIVRTVTPEVECHYVPHAVKTDVFTPLSKEITRQMQKDNFPEHPEGKFIFFWNNRNARRKMPGSVIWWFKDFLDEVGHDKAMLLMHTDPYDQNGPNLQAIVEELGLLDGQVLFSRQKVEPKYLNAMYNMADCTINISDAEGFGLSVLESLSSGTPVIATMTGGMQDQITDGSEQFGVGIEPASKALIGSQMVPFIYEDRVCKEDFIKALHKMYSMSAKERKELSVRARGHAINNFSYETYAERWVTLMKKIHKKYGSWDTRKNYKSWTFEEAA
jgi:glycosyltransferase involved in cell wall biosynthesis